MQHDAAGDAVFHDGVLCAGGTLIRLRGRGARGRQAFFPNPVWDSSITLSQRGSVTVWQRRAALLRRLVPQRLDHLLPAGDGQRDQRLGDRLVTLPASPRIAHRTFPTPAWRGRNLVERADAQVRPRHQDQTAHSGPGRETASGEGFHENDSLDYLRRRTLARVVGFRPRPSSRRSRRTTPRRSRNSCRAWSRVTRSPGRRPARSPRAAWRRRRTRSASRPAPRCSASTSTR
jgi:hypothetical protein